MKVKIGPYRSFFGPYQLAEKLCFWARPIEEDGAKEVPLWVDKFGEWLAHGRQKKKKRGRFPFHEPHNTLLYRFFLWIDKKRERKISVKIDHWDTWNMDETLAHIILPMLKQLAKTKRGAPHVADKDVPKHLRSTSAPPKENVWDVDAHHFARWDWVLNEMIFAFDSEVGEGRDWQDQFHSGELDLINTPTQVDENGEPILFELKTGPNHTHTWDQKNHNKYRDRIQNGFRLFGKYYSSLWD